MNVDQPTMTCHPSQKCSSSQSVYGLTGITGSTVILLLGENYACKSNASMPMLIKLGL